MVTQQIQYESPIQPTCGPVCIITEEHSLGSPVSWLTYRHLVQELDLEAKVSAVFIHTFEMPLPPS